MVGTTLSSLWSVLAIFAWVAEETLKLLWRTGTVLAGESLLEKERATIGSRELAPHDLALASFSRCLYPRAVTYRARRPKILDTG